MVLEMMVFPFSMTGIATGIISMLCYIQMFTLQNLQEPGWTENLETKDMIISGSGQSDVKWKRIIVALIRHMVLREVEESRSIEINIENKATGCCLSEVAACRNTIGRWKICRRHI